MQMSLEVALELKIDGERPNTYTVTVSDTWRGVLCVGLISVSFLYDTV